MTLKSKSATWMKIFQQDTFKTVSLTRTGFSMGLQLAFILANRYRNKRLWLMMCKDTYHGEHNFLSCVWMEVKKIVRGWMIKKSNRNPSSKINYNDIGPAWSFFSFSFFSLAWNFTRVPLLPSFRGCVSFWHKADHPSTLFESDLMSMDRERGIPI